MEIESFFAKDRQLTGTTLASNDAKGKAVAKVAKQIAVSTATFERAKKIIEKAPEEVKNKVRSGKQSINYAYQQVQRAEKHSNPPDLPKGEFDILYADPPWKYDFAETDGTADVHYNAMETSEITALQVPCDNHPHSQD